MLRRTTMVVAAAAAASLTTPASAFECSDLWSLPGKACKRVADSWQNGNSELLISGYAYHLRSTYTDEKLRELNERAWGLGYARTKYDEDGDAHMVYGLAFHESHNKVQWNFGYGYQTYWGNRDGVQAGLGYTALLVQRPDIAGGVPIPALLPLASVKYGKATVMATFIPTLNNGINNGSVLYVFGKVQLK